MLNPLSPLAANRTTVHGRQAVMDLCKTLRTSGAIIPPDADKTLAEALLSREQGSADLTIAALTLLGANSRVVSILELAWQKNEPALDALLADGTLITFLNAPLIQALLYSSPIPNLSMERLLLHVRKRLLGCAIDPSWHADASTVKTATSMAAYAYLTEYAFEESTFETELVSQLVQRLGPSVGSAIDPFDVAVLASYRRLKDIEITTKIEPVLKGLNEPELEALWRCHVLEPTRETALVSDIPSLSNIEDITSTAVRDLYEENPYPRWVCFHRNEPQTANAILKRACAGIDLEAFGEINAPDLLVAGCGSGLAAIDDAILWKNSEVLAVDLSLNSIAYGQRCCEEMQLSSVEFAQADILNLAALDRAFDYVSCTGVLHHMKDPIAGLAVLAGLCRPGGVMRVGLYSEPSRQAVIAGRHVLQGVSDGRSLDGVRNARQTLIAHAFQTGELDKTYSDVFETFDFYNLSMCRDLLLHVHEEDFTIPKVRAAINQLGLQFCGFVDPNGYRMEAYRRFAPDDPAGLDLDSWTKFEEQNPRTFSPMYDFMVQKPAG